jgi:hypothetical protein
MLLLPWMSSSAAALTPSEGSLLASLTIDAFIMGEGVADGRSSE